MKKTSEFLYSFFNHITQYQSFTNQINQIMQKSAVKVTANEAGQVVILTKNPEFAYIRVVQRVAKMKGGWMRNSLRSAIISGRTDELKALGFVKGQELPGHIQVIEQHEPFNLENPEKDIKIAGDTGVICTFNGEPIFRKTFYTENEEHVDKEIEHDNDEEIKAKRQELALESAEDNSAEL